MSFPLLHSRPLNQNNNSSSLSHDEEKSNGDSSTYSILPPLHPLMVTFPMKDNIQYSSVSERSFRSNKTMNSAHSSVAPDSKRNNLNNFFLGRHTIDEDHMERIIKQRQTMSHDGSSFFSISPRSFLKKRIKVKSLAKN